MPAASWRTMPARSINRCETISASFGVSRRIGKKNRDSRMGSAHDSGERASGAVKPDHSAKYKHGNRFNGFSPPKKRRPRPDFGLMIFGAVHDNHGDKLDRNKVGVTYPLNGAHLRNNVALRRLRSKSVGGKPASR